VVMAGNLPRQWRKSSFSVGDSCVECATTGRAVWVRDSKDPQGPELAFDPEAWTAFIAGVRRGDFDRI